MNGRTNHPRKAFCEDLQSFLTSLCTKGHDVIIGGDFNETLQDKNSGLLQLATANQLTDPFLHRHPCHQDFGTHVAGTRRIDSVLVTAALLPCITAIGYAPYDYANNSDHRPLLIEFKTSLLFGYSSTTLQPPRSRALLSKDKIAVRVYINHLYNELLNAKAFQQIAQIEEDTVTHAMVEELDTLLGKLEDLSEAKCRRRRSPYYSRCLVRQRFEVSVLSRHLNCLKRDIDRTTQLMEKMSRVGIHVHLPPTQELTRKALREARTKLQQICKDSFDTRQAELDIRIQTLSEHNQKPKKQILQAIRKVESSLHTYRTLQAIKRTTSGQSSLDRLEIPASWPPPSHSIHSLAQLEDPKTCSEWKTITEPHEIEHYLVLRNRLHFGQAEGSPFTTAPLLQDVDWSATSDHANSILAGHYVSHITTPQAN